MIFSTFKEFKKNYKKKNFSQIYAIKDKPKLQTIEKIIELVSLSKDSFIFESVEKVKIRGRYTIFGFNPDLVIETNNNRIIQSINNKRKIKSTVNHKFLTTDGWKRLDELKIGDEIINDRGVVKTLVTQEFTYHNTEEVFDMTVEDNHNFIILSTMSNYGIIAHNCQDLNTTQRLLIESSINTNGGRFVFIGDKKQNIYKFCGSNTESFDYLCNKPNTITLPLSVTYRCPPTIVNMVKHLNPNIVSHTNIDNGKIYNEYSYKNLRDGDMVLCRETFPLVSLCIRLFSEGRKSIIIGSDIGLSICRLISDLEKKNEEFTMEYVFSQLYYTKNKFIRKA